MLDTYAGIAGKVLLRCPMAGSLLAKDWVSHAFRRVAERRRWSWLMKRGQFLVPASYSTGTVTVTRSSTTVTGAGTTWTNAMIGRQFRTSGANPIYTISAVPAVGTITLDQAWGGSTAALQTYEIYQCLFETPTDFHALYSVFDPSMNWQLRLNITQRELNAWDAQRSNSGQAYMVAFYDYYLPAGQTVTVPRFELWPHKKSEYVYVYWYESRPTDLEDSGATLPRFVRGDALLELALAEAARWPGPSEDKKNPYYDLKLATLHEARSERHIFEMERQDEEVFTQDVEYASSLPFAPFADADWAQSHSL